MSIKLRPVLAGVIGMLILLIPASMQTADRFPPLLSAKAGGEEANNRGLRFHADTGSSRGLYGYRYRGF